MGRIIKEKGVLELIKAASILKKRHSNLIFNFIGDFDIKKNSRKLNKFFYLSIKKNIINYHGYIQNISKFVNNSHAVILPSYREGLSHSLLVSASMSRPLIASDVPGCRDLVINGHNGYLFKSKEVESLVKVINNFLNLTDSQRKLMGIRSRKIVEKKYDEKFISQKYLFHIEKLFR